MDKYLITGATGYIGSLIVKNLLSNISDTENKLSVTAIVRDTMRAKSMLSDNINIINADITDTSKMSEIKGDFDYILHCASTTKSSQMISNPVETASGIVIGTQNVLDLARRSHVKSMVYLSSMEIYGNIDCTDGHLVSEEELGELDILHTRSCYPLGKRMAEHFCYAYFKEYDIPVKIARLAQTFGAGILPGETRVFAQFANAVINNDNIVLHTAGNAVGNYCEVQESINAIMLILKKGADGEAYNVVNEANTMTIRQMAQLVAERVAKGKISVEFNISKQNNYGYAPDTGIRLSSEKLRELGWSPVKDLQQMYNDVIDCLKNMSN
ncbi:MAG: NAD(P)-dependent oxidoreductase [Clostridiales bacterium]|nr:NAD(P)-dependent oxidoreductase [Clostridiales bacterium]